eukprot:m.273795 g.273795  ORF g.273795 m.273795 type:complete len:337 (+) comp26886_c5_seq1:383-1393(+)
MGRRRRKKAASHPSSIPVTWCPAMTWAVAIVPSSRRMRLSASLSDSSSSDALFVTRTASSTFSRHRSFSIRRRGSSAAAVAAAAMASDESCSSLSDTARRVRRPRRFAAAATAARICISSRSAKLSETSVACGAEFSVEIVATPSVWCRSVSSTALLLSQSLCTIILGIDPMNVPTDVPTKTPIPTPTGPPKIPKAPPVRAPTLPACHFHLLAFVLSAATTSPAPSRVDSAALPMWSSIRSTCFVCRASSSQIIALAWVRSSDCTESSRHVCSCAWRSASSSYAVWCGTRYSVTTCCASDVAAPAITHPSSALLCPCAPSTSDDADMLSISMSVPR